MIGNSSLLGVLIVGGLLSGIPVVCWSLLFGMVVVFCVGRMCWSLFSAGPGLVSRMGLGMPGEVGAEVWSVEGVGGGLIW